MRGGLSLPAALNANGTRASQGGGSCTQEWPAQLGFRGAEILSAALWRQLLGRVWETGSIRAAADGTAFPSGELLEPRAAAASTVRG